MSSLNIVWDTRALIQNKLLVTVPKKWQPQIRFGLQAYSLQAFQSAAGNARRVTSSPNAAALRAARSEERQHRSFTDHTIDALQDFADRPGFWPKLVFDRGFGNESMVTHPQAEGATFYIRIKPG